MADYKYNPPENAGISTQNNNNEANKPRIYQVFSSSIILDEISFPEKQGDGKTQRIEDYVSYEFPFIKINNYIFSKTEIDLFKIDTRDKIPSITLTVTFATEKFLSRELPKDGDIISVAIRSKSDALKILRNDYVIMGLIPARKSTNVKGAIVMTFFGKLFIPGIESFMGATAFNGTSMGALKSEAKKLGLGFATNEGETDDKQIWIRYDTPYFYIDNVVDKSWKNEVSFFDWWIDIYYNLNFVNVQKQLLASEDDIDPASFITNIQKGYYWGSEDDKVINIPKVFSNYISYRSSSFYITDWRPINRSSEITFIFGTYISTAFFEHNNILYEDPEAEKYWELKIEPAYDPEKVKSHILLRGRTRYDSSINNDELARANYNYTEIYMKNPWMGIQYTISNPEADNSQWTGNHHKNYLRAQVQNSINLAELEKLNVEINVQGINLNIIKGDKIPVVLIKKDPVEGILANPDIDNTTDTLDYFYSGWYYVKDFSLLWTQGEDGVINNFSQNFILTRREWPTPIPVDPIK